MIPFRRRVDLIFGIGYEDEAEKAQRIMREVLDAHPMVLADPEPVVRLHELKRRFDAEGITIPFPQRDVHLYRHTADGE